MIRRWFSTSLLCPEKAQIIFHFSCVITAGQVHATDVRRRSKSGLRESKKWVPCCFRLAYAPCIGATWRTRSLLSPRSARPTRSQQLRCLSSSYPCSIPACCPKRAGGCCPRGPPHSHRAARKNLPTWLSQTRKEKRDSKQSDDGIVRVQIKRISERFVLKRMLISSAGGALLPLPPAGHNHLRKSTKNNVQLS